MADFGVGIRATLSARVPTRDDADAIRQAVREEVSGRTSRRNLGLGLSHLHAIVRLSGGQMVIYSGSGLLRLVSGRDRYGHQGQPFPGTLVFVRLPLREGDDVIEPVDVWQ